MAKVGKSLVHKGERGPGKQKCFAEKYLERFISSLWISLDTMVELKLTCILLRK
jgi:hypothetical protein